MRSPPLPLGPIFLYRTSMLTCFAEIYRIVSSKALDQGEGSQNVLDANRRPLDISTPADEGQKKNGCC